MPASNLPILKANSQRFFRKASLAGLLLVTAALLLAYTLPTPAAAPPAAANQTANQVPGPALATAASSQALADLAAALRLDGLASLADHDLQAGAKAFALAVNERGGDSAAALRLILPSNNWFQARMITPADEEPLRWDALNSRRYGRAYRILQAQVPSSRLQAGALQRLLNAVWQDLAAVAALAAGPAPVMARADQWLPLERLLNNSHRYALDIFFTRVERTGAAESGPDIHSLTRGIVVACAADWEGGASMASYLTGGLSPKAGNGVIVYTPDTGRYHAYFHMSTIAVERGQLVAAGQRLGRGGNTGINARSRGHGEHLHIEIHEADGRTWTNRELWKLLTNLR
ncbi:MAG: hypothetical protein A2087_11870 [Spirochaetes bacterium GWD1_61_31]|nr:MAG: hypothetical protein A2Y37_04745 [Spirochaetes bacterium GWB1_60_80]OHD34794.1 MAG: hypothetical protein A2004_08745 [Spirochaetes bacterium GWC1_61_12]OHD41732.1 MAG: hypothetical protein A2087_11870 [Spirochaetes bacterium GWD1_61_31]OHD44602.1 MAG: hypothetical protein A2Y35_11945 [Spirochaetes bacterium GWE1_60_18]OHD57927.1 MAG: hypothetical protein A2Y32_03940 [Spirochaetes bacterium GWF1_60_12]